MQYTYMGVQSFFHRVWSGGVSNGNLQIVIHNQVSSSSDGTGCINIFEEDSNVGFECFYAYSVTLIKWHSN